MSYSSTSRKVCADIKAAVALCRDYLALDKTLMSGAEVIQIARALVQADKLLRSERTMRDDYHPNLDGPAEPVGLSMPSAEGARTVPLVTDDELTAAYAAGMKNADPNIVGVHAAHCAGLRQVMECATPSATLSRDALPSCDAPGNVTYTLKLSEGKWYCHGCGASELEPRCKYRKSVFPSESRNG